MHSELVAMFDQQKAELKEEMTQMTDIFKQSQGPFSPSKREKDQILSSESGSSKVYRIPKLNNNNGFKFRS
jgi:hypothetical protein